LAVIQKIRKARARQSPPHLGMKTSEETKEKQRIGNLGKKMSWEARIKISLSQRGVKKSAEFCEKMRVIMSKRKISKESRIIIGLKHRGKYVSIAARNKMRLAHIKRGTSVGERSPNWKRGITKVAKQVRTCDRYKQWRKSIFKRDHYECQFCGAMGRLQVDHIKPFSFILNEEKVKTMEDAMKSEALWDMSNGRTLCEECHRKTPTFSLQSKRAFWAKNV